MLATVLRCALAGLLIAALDAPARAGGKKATVRGAEAVNVRDSPSPDSPAFVALTRGRTVTVEQVIGAWALVTLDSGRKGYVKAVFLELPAGVQVVAAPAGPPALTPAPAPPSPLPTDTAANAPEAHADARRDLLEREVAQLRDRLAALESAVVPTPMGATPAGRPGAEVAPTEEATAGQSEHTLAAAPLLPSIPQPPEPQEFGPSLALAGVGLVIGFLLGAAYGRRQERNRRSRVRF